MTDPLSSQSFPQKSVSSTLEALSFVHDQGLPSRDSLEYALRLGKRFIGREYDMGTELLLGHGAFREELVLAEERRVRKPHTVRHFLLC